VNVDTGAFQALTAQVAGLAERVDQLDKQALVKTVNEMMIKRTGADLRRPRGGARPPRSAFRIPNRPASAPAFRRRRPAVSAPTEVLSLVPNLDRRPGEWSDIRPHGTEDRAMWHRRRGERPCPPCLAAENAAHAYRRTAAADAPVLPEPPTEEDR